MSLLRHLLPLLPPSPRILDACCGTGHVGLALAHLLPHASLTLVDRSPRALAIARARARDAGLANVAFVESAVEHLAPGFDALVALHACGGASDVCLAKAVAARAVACVIPCCTGGSVTLRGRVTGRAREARVRDPRREGCDVEWGLARSDAFRAALGRSEYEELARCADGVEPIGALAKALLEMDRVTWVRECGRECWLGKVGGGVKDDVIVVAPREGGVWKRDLVAGGGGDEFLEGRMEAVKRVLTEVVIGKGERFVAGGGRSARKVVHGAADALGLAHWSEGRGKDRVVMVAPGKSLGNEEEDGGGEIYYRGYIGACSTTMSNLARTLLKHVPEEYVAQKESVRGTEHHITLFNAREVRALSRELLTLATESLRGTEIVVHGVGRVSSSTGWEARDECTEEAYYIVLDWPALQTLRESHGLARLDAHITLGFRTADIHDVAKNLSSVVVQHKTRFTF